MQLVQHPSREKILLIHQMSKLRLIKIGTAVIDMFIKLQTLLYEIDSMS